MSQQSTLTHMLRRGVQGLGGDYQRTSMNLGDVPSDYGPQYSGTVMAPYNPNGPLGGTASSSQNFMSALTGKSLARAQFLTWLKTFNPALFEDAVKRAESWKASVVASTGNPAALSGLGDGDTEPTTWWQTLVGTLPALGTAYLAYEGQQNVMNTNIQRANMGLPPIDPATGAPQVAVGLSPQLMARLQDTTSYLLIGGLAIGAVVLLMSFLKGGKRR